MIDEPFSTTFGPVVEESTSNTVVTPIAAVASLRTGLKSIESLGS